MTETTKAQTRRATEQGASGGDGLRARTSGADPAQAEPRRLTPTERLHDIARAMAERQSQRHPSFAVSQVKAVGGSTVIEWDVQVPVCDEFPTAEDAFMAATEYAARNLALYPPPNPNGDAGGRERKA